MTQIRKVLEVYIPKGSRYDVLQSFILYHPLTISRDGDRIILEGESDQIPGQEPGNIVLSLAQEKHEVFTRSGANLFAEADITLAEALTGFRRVIIRHLDGRGLKMKYPRSEGRTMEPGQVIKIVGEGMTRKKSELRGNLYITIRIKFPKYAWLRQHNALSAIKDLLPRPDPPIDVPEVDEISYDEMASLDEREDSGAEDWEDDENDREGQTQCFQQ